MKDSLVVEFKKLKKRYKKLVLEGKELQDEHEQNLKIFIDNSISNQKWQFNLGKTACNLAKASTTMKIAENRMKKIWREIG